jgi:hypothetical protein
MGSLEWIPERRPVLRSVLVHVQRLGVVAFRLGEPSPRAGERMKSPRRPNGDRLDESHRVIVRIRRDGDPADLGQRGQLAPGGVSEVGYQSLPAVQTPG